VLDHYVGTWHGKMQVPPTQENPQGLTVEGTVHADWIVDGRWLRQEVDFEPAGGHSGMAVCTMMTYDPKTKKYLLYSFQQSGKVDSATATWDEAAKTMTSVLQSAPNGPVVTVKANFSKEGTENWTMFIHDPDGNLVGKVQGQNVKQ